MIKELEALEDFQNKLDYYFRNSTDKGWYNEYIYGLQQALQRLEAIDNYANPSKVLECLENLRCLVDVSYDTDNLGEEQFEEYLKDLNTIKATLLKAQERENENKKMKNILLELADIYPDNVDCINQCKSITNTILKAGISKDINNKCKKNLKKLDLR